MHHRRLFALFHRTHHLSRTPTPWTAYSFALPEAVVHCAFVPLFLLVVPMHGLGLLAFGIVQILRNVMGHAGAEVHSAAFGPGRWLGWNNTTTHHDLHHEAGRYNYGLYFRLWDRLMGTEHPDYRRKFEAIVSPAATNTAASASMRGATSMSAGNSRPNTAGAHAMPSKNAMRQPTSPLRGTSKPPKMPLMPKMRPLSKIKAAEASPSSTPPASAVYGVNWIQSIVTVYSSCGPQNWWYSTCITASACGLVSW